MGTSRPMQNHWEAGKKMDTSKNCLLSFPTRVYCPVGTLILNTHTHTSSQAQEVALSPEALTALPSGPDSRLHL